MVKYTIMISGVHYGANGDLVAGQKDTPEMHKRTHELLAQSWGQSPGYTEKHKDKNAVS